MFLKGLMFLKSLMFFNLHPRLCNSFSDLLRHYSQYHTIHPFKLYNSMTFSIFTELCSHQDCQIRNILTGNSLADSVLSLPGPRFNPWWGNWYPASHLACQKKKKKNQNQKHQLVRFAYCVHVIHGLIQLWFMFMSFHLKDTYSLEGKLWPT